MLVPSLLAGFKGSRLQPMHRYAYHFTYGRTHVSLLIPAPAPSDAALGAVLGGEIISYEFPGGLAHVVQKPLQDLLRSLPGALCYHLVVSSDDDVHPGKGVLEKLGERQVEHVGTALLDRPVQPVAVVGLALLAPGDVAPAT